MKYKFTVFTPTFNRAYTLQRVFDSLMSQTIRHCDFEWILINDGSTDNTDDLVKKFSSQANFDIRYIKQENKGKNYCHNKAIKLAKGELFLILDSDDAIIPKCMNVFWKYWKKLDDATRKDIYGINCLCKDGNTGLLIGKNIQDGIIENAFKWKHKNKIYFETWGALNIKLFKQYLFPEADEIKFIPEAYIWDKVNQNRKIFSINETLRIIYHQNDGFSKNIINSYKNHAKGRYIYHKMVIDELFWDLIKINPIRLLKDFIQFGRIGLHSNYNFKKMLKDINNNYKRIIFFLVLPISLYLFKKDQYK
ncbi:MAG: glycosyltransferase family 2 protein [Sulfurospirillum sp.]